MFRVLVLVAFLMAPSPSDACSIVPVRTSPHTLDPAEVDDVAAPTISSVTGAAHRSEPDGCGPPSGAACEGLASISVKVDATDDRTPNLRLGYILKVLPGGDPPDGFKGWGADAVELQGSEFYDFISYDDEDFNFDIEVRVVDLNGNVSEPKVVHLESNTLTGCSVARSDWTVLPVLGFLLRRRRRR